ncbi:MAG: acetyl-CoA hydrolase/transferase C-terminal domain-containing protein [Lysobacterales bacterium]
MSTETVSLQAAIERIVAVAGPHIIAALPLGLGKPNRLINALTARVSQDPNLRLTIYTALSLDPPQPKPGLEAAFAGPFLDRQFGPDYPALDYVRALKRGTLRERIEVHEFYFQSGAWLNVAPAQRNYISLNYTHVARAVAERGVNVILQMVARRGDRLSLSCNTDTTQDTLDAIAARGGARPLIVCAIHPQLPFLGNDAELPLDFADLLVEEPGHRLFALPREPVLEHEFAIGLHASTLVKDGGTLQIGIGALSDAVVHGLLLRQQHNAEYREIMSALRQGAGMPEVVAEHGGEQPLAAGLYGASEMVMDGFMHLRRAGLLRRLVFDDLGLQTLLNRGLIGRVCDASTLARLIEAELVPVAMDRPSLDWLMRFGLLPEGTLLHEGLIRFADGGSCGADLLVPAHRAALTARMAGRALRGGRYLHGAFYLGSRPLYDWLAGLDGEDYTGLAMTRVGFINQLYGGREALDIAQRQHARFFNTCMMQTLSGSAVSDGLDDGRLVSGVGGQYNFVAMAHAIPNGRSILMLRAVRDSAQGARSNILWNYAHCTIPRHLRDLVVTEYGIADLRGQCDEEVIKRLLAISDARCIDALTEEAKQHGKLAADFQIPASWRQNTPAFLRDRLAPYYARERFRRYPFGSDFDADELALLPALTQLKAAGATRIGRIQLLLRALFSAAPSGEPRRLLGRVGLAAPRTLADRLLARMLAHHLPG